MNGRQSSRIEYEETSNIANNGNSDKSFETSHQFELVKHIQDKSNSEYPILYIDIKISHEEVSRLVIYKNQEPFDAAIEFINKHKIAPKLRPYLIAKVQAHYDKICS